MEYTENWRKAQEKQKTKKINNKFYGRQVQEACEKREEMKVLASGE